MIFLHFLEQLERAKYPKQSNINKQRPNRTTYSILVKTEMSFELPVNIDIKPTRKVTTVVKAPRSSTFSFFIFLIAF